MEDAEALRAQLGRAPRAQSVVVRRCALRLPIVVAVPPVLATGEPFPTRYWLSCPLARKRIARLENAGGVRHFDARAAHDPDFAAALAAAHASYAEERDQQLDPESERRPGGGVAGIDHAGVKCLHAHFAHHAAGGANPVGAAIAPFVESLECSSPCVGPEPWAEPPHPVSGPRGDASRAFDVKGDEVPEASFGEVAPRAKVDVPVVDHAGDGPSE